MKLGETLKFDAGARVETQPRNTIQFCRLSAGTLRRLKFVFDFLMPVLSQLKQITREPLKVAINRFTRDDRLHQINGCFVATGNLRRLLGTK